MGKITIQQNEGIDHIITIPDGPVKITSPNGGSLDLDKPILIVSIKESKKKTPEKPVETNTETLETNNTDSESNTASATVTTTEEETTSS